MSQLLQSYLSSAQDLKIPHMLYSKISTKQTDKTIYRYYCLLWQSVKVQLSISMLPFMQNLPGCDFGELKVQVWEIILITNAGQERTIWPPRTDFAWTGAVQRRKNAKSWSQKRWIRETCLTSSLNTLEGSGYCLKGKCGGTASKTTCKILGRSERWCFSAWSLSSQWNLMPWGIITAEQSEIWK